MLKLKDISLIHKIEFAAVIVGYIITIIWIVEAPKKPDPYVAFLFTIPLLIDAIRRLIKLKKLSYDETFTLAFILTDPQASTRGAWLYPLHQQLTKRGFKDSNVTSILSSLTKKGLIKFVEIESYDSLHKRVSKAPAYKVTKKGIDYITDNKSEIPDIKETYIYKIKMYGTQNENQLFLESIEDLDFVQAQTRFITEKDKGFCTIAAFTYKPLNESDIKHLEKINKVRIYSFKESE